MRIKAIPLLITILVSLSAYAQREVRVCASATYYMSEHQTPSQAKFFALQLAQRKAIEQAFGVQIQSQVNSVQTNEKEHFSIVSENQARAIWIKDAKEPVYELGLGIDGKKGLSYTCTVDGYVRELKTSFPEVDVQVYNGSFKRRDKRTDFQSGDKIYLTFRSPVDGYLAIYCYNSEADEVGCALPYERQSKGIYEVSADKTYRLFSKHEARDTPEAPYVDEYQMTADHEMEFNVLYVLFSPNKFYKASDQDGDAKRLRSLDYKTFNKWLCRQRAKDGEMTVTCIPLEVKGAGIW